MCVGVRVGVYGCLYVRVCVWSRVIDGFRRSCPVVGSLRQNLHEKRGRCSFHYEREIGTIPGAVYLHSDLSCIQCDLPQSVPENFWR